MQYNNTILNLYIFLSIVFQTVLSICIYKFFNDFQLMQQELLRLNNEVFLLNKELIAKNIEIVNLKTLILDSTTNIKPSEVPINHYDYLYWVLITVGLTSGIIGCYNIYSHLSWNYIGYWLGILYPTITFVDSGNNTIKVSYDWLNGYQLYIKSVSTGQKFIQYPDVGVLVQSLSQIKNQTPISQDLAAEITLSALEKFPPVG